MTTEPAAAKTGPAPGESTPRNIVCLDNGIHLLCGFRATTAGDLLAPQRSGAAEVVSMLLAAEPPRWRVIERDVARKRLHADLLPVVDQLLNGGGAQGPARTDGHAEGPYSGAPPLEVHAPDLLGRQAYALRLSKAARSRLARAGVSPSTAQRVAVVPEAATLFMLASGVAMLALHLRVQLLGARPTTDGSLAALPQPLLEEAAYALGHANDREEQLLRAARAVAPRGAQATLPAGTMVVPDATIGHAMRPATEDDLAAAARTPDAGGRAAPRPLPLLLDVQEGSSDSILLAQDDEQLSLDDLLARLTGLPAAAWTGQTNLARAAGSPLVAAGDSRHGRRFLLCSALYASETPDDELPRLAYSLARRYGADYLLSGDEFGTSTVRPFGNICHAMATQGAAIVIRDTGAPFVRDFVDAAVPATYLPLAVLNYHEYLQLRHLTQECAFMPDVVEPAHDKDRLMRLRSALAAFRLYFRFSHVSDLAHHNRVHRAWRDALDLDRMLQEVTLDVREAEQVLARIHQDAEDARHHREERERKRWRKLGVVGLALAGFAAWMHLFEALLDLVFPRKAWLLQALKGDGRSWSELASDPALREVLHLYHAAHTWEAIAVAAAVLLGVAVGVFASKGGSHGAAGH